MCPNTGQPPRRCLKHVIQCNLLLAVIGLTLNAGRGLPALRCRARCCPGDVPLTALCCGATTGRNQMRSKPIPLQALGRMSRSASTLSFPGGRSSRVPGPWSVSDIWTLEYVFGHASQSFIDARDRLGESPWLESERMPSARSDPRVCSGWGVALMLTWHRPHNTENTEHKTTT